MSTDFLIAGGFYTFAALAVVGALGILRANLVFHSALYLVLTLGSVAAVFVILGADFLAAVQILVYIGAIMVLILFGIMLTPRAVEIKASLPPGRTVAGGILALALFAIMASVVLTTHWSKSVPAPMDRPTIDLIAQGLFGAFAFPFELASVLLVVAMIGAIVIAREE